MLLHMHGAIQRCDIILFIFYFHSHNLGVTDSEPRQAGKDPSFRGDGMKKRDKKAGVRVYLVCPRKQETCFVSEIA